MSAPFDGWAIPSGMVPGLPTRTDGGVRHPILDRAAARALVAALRGARGEALLGHDAATRARLLGRAGARFLDPADPLRREAEEMIPATAQLSAPMARAVIDGMARDWSAPRLCELLAAELSYPDALERFVAGPHGTRVRAYPPALSFHVGSGTVPGVSATSMLRALLVGSATLLKPGRGDVVLPVLLARALAEEAPTLARAVAVVYWGGGSGEALETVALEEADLVVAYGGDAILCTLRARLPVTTPLIAYHQRISAALVGRAALAPSRLTDVAEALARAVSMFDQRGCVSPHAVFVETGGHVSPRELARALADALARMNDALPPGPGDPTDASAVHQLRRTAELRAAAGEAVELWASPGASWTVLMEPGEELELSCLGRTVRVHPVGDAAEVPGRLAGSRRHMQTVGVAGLGERLERCAEMLADAGATRVCPLEKIPFPPPWWHHDGQGPLRSLLRWVDLEG